MAIMLGVEHERELVDCTPSCERFPCLSVVDVDARRLLLRFRATHPTLPSPILNPDTTPHHPQTSNQHSPHTAHTKIHPLDQPPL